MSRSYQALPYDVAFQRAKGHKPSTILEKFSVPFSEYVDLISTGLLPSHSTQFYVIDRGIIEQLEVTTSSVVFGQIRLYSPENSYIKEDTQTIMRKEYEEIDNPELFAFSQGKTARFIKLFSELVGDTSLTKEFVESLVGVPYKIRHKNVAFFNAGEVYVPSFEPEPAVALNVIATTENFVSGVRKSVDTDTYYRHDMFPLLYGVRSVKEGFSAHSPRRVSERSYIQEVMKVVNSGNSLEAIDDVKEFELYRKFTPY